jgi:hypothetical protein
MYFPHAPVSSPCSKTQEKIGPPSSNWWNLYTWNFQQLLFSVTPSAMAILLYVPKPAQLDASPRDVKVSWASNFRLEHSKLSYCQFTANHNANFPKIYPRMKLALCFIFSTPYWPTENQWTASYNFCFTKFVLRCSVGPLLRMGLDLTVLRKSSKSVMCPAYRLISLDWESRERGYFTDRTVRNAFCTTHADSVV